MVSHETVFDSVIVSNEFFTWKMEIASFMKKKK